MRGTVFVAAATVLLLLLAAPTSAQSLPPFHLVGEDAEGDSDNQIAPGVSGNAVFNPARTDILSLQFAQDDDTLYVKLNIGIHPSGTGGYMYHVQFDVDGSTYYTCWNIQWTGNEDAQENVLGCSRFTTGTPVGPGTQADGVELGQDSAGAFVLWPVARSAIGSPADDADYTDIFATTWFRGASPGSTNNAQNLWRQADAAPDDAPDETFTFQFLPLEEPSPPSIAIELPEGNLTVIPGGLLAVPLNVTLAGDLDNLTAEANFTVHLQTGPTPDGWIVEFTPQNLTLSANATRSEALLELILPPGMEEGPYNLTLQVLLDGELAALATLEFTVSTDDGAAPPGDDPEEDETPAGRGIPGPGGLVALVLVALAAQARRR